MKEYIGGAKPLFSVGEYWDSCNYNGHGLDYNQGIIYNFLEARITEWMKILYNWLWHNDLRVELDLL